MGRRPAPWRLRSWCLEWEVRDEFERLDAEAGVRRAGHRAHHPLLADGAVGAVDRPDHRALVVLPPPPRRPRRAVGRAPRRRSRAATSPRPASCSRPAGPSRRRSSARRSTGTTSGTEAVEQILVKATRLRRKKFESGLLFLGTLGNNAPFIGLFGTVLGIVTAFRELGGQPDAARHGQRHGRHRRGAARHRHRHPGRAPGGHLLQRVPEEGRRHRGERRRRSATSCSRR